MILWLFLVRFVCRFCVNTKQMNHWRALFFGQKGSFCHPKHILNEMEKWEIPPGILILDSRHLISIWQRDRDGLIIIIKLKFLRASLPFLSHTLPHTRATKTRELIRYNDGILSTNSSEIRGIIYLDTTILHTKYITSLNDRITVSQSSENGFSCVGEMKMLNFIPLHRNKDQH